MQICIGAIVRNPALQSQTKSPGVFLQTPFPHTLLVVILHSSISAHKYKVYLLKKILHVDLTNTLDSTVIIIITFVACAAVSANCISTPSILANSWELDTFIDVFPFNKSLSFWAKF